MSYTRITKSNFLEMLRKASWAPLAVLLGHAIAGKVFGHEPYVDPVMHFFGGAAIAYFFYYSLQIMYRESGFASRLTILCIAVSLACNAALFWEFGEFVSDRVFGTNVQRDLMNTMRDLILGALGASVAATAISASHWNSRLRER
jgi:hypothetical protein